MNVWDILILIAVAAAVALAVRTVRGGKTCRCGGDCACCPHACGKKPEP